MIPEEVIEQVRESADILGIIGESVDLKRTGADWRGPCPFHGGKGRNFAVIPRKNLFYCYVCHEAGDIFSYMMKRFGMDYPTAVRDIARRSGIVVPERTERAGPDPNEPLVSAAAWSWITSTRTTFAASGVASLAWGISIVCSAVLFRSTLPAELRQKASLLVCWIPDVEE